MSSSLSLSIVNPVLDQSWDRLAASFGGCSFFHTAAWARVLIESYRYAPCYLVIREGTDPVAALPFMEVDTMVTARRGVSLPFSDICEPLVRENGYGAAVLGEVMAFADSRKWKHWEIRGDIGFDPDTPVSARYHEHVIDLAGNEDDLNGRLRSSTRRNIKKAVKEGVTIEIAESREALREFVRLNAITRRHHGLPPQPKRFFDKVFEHVITPGNGHIALARHENRIIAANMYFRHGGVMVYKYGASDQQFNHLRSNYAVMWEAVRHAARSGCQTLSMGRTHPDNTGLIQFKDGWGAEAKEIRYHQYDCQLRAFVEHGDSLAKSYNEVFRRMPLPVSQFIGSLAYRHMG